MYSSTKPCALFREHFDLLHFHGYQYLVTLHLLIFARRKQRLVVKQLMNYLSDNHLLPDRQSAYRAFHSTETAVLRVLSDILLALDSGNLAMLTLLDLSAAFDSVDHATLLRWLQLSYILGGTVIIIIIIIHEFRLT